jgi:hypothetical protein
MDKICEAFLPEVATISPARPPETDLQFLPAADRNEVQATRPTQRPVVAASSKRPAAKPAPRPPQPAKTTITIETTTATTTTPAPAVGQKAAKKVNTYHNTVGQLEGQRGNKLNLCRQRPHCTVLTPKNYTTNSEDKVD